MKQIAKQLFLYLFLSCVISLTALANKGRNAEYVITVKPDQPNVMHIRATIPVSGGHLSMYQDGAEQFPRRWAEFVSDLKITDVEGHEVKFRELPEAEWKLESPPNSFVKLSYTVILEHEKHKWPGGIDGVAFASNGNVFATGRTYIIASADPADSRDIAVRFDVPVDWKVSSSWKPAGRDPRTFVARDRADLFDSMLLAGDHDQLSFKRKGFELLFAISGQGLRTKKPQFASLASGVLAYYINLMGGIPAPPPSSKFERVLVVISQGKNIDGEVIGNQISMILDPDGDEQSQLVGKFIFAHEFFHLWNGKSINVATTGEDWFKEGVTSYYTLKALHKTGTISEKQYFGTLNGLFYQRYAVDPGLGNASMRDVASGMSKDKHWGLIYGGGLFAGMCQDVAIRNATNNKKSLDNIMRELFKDLGGSDKTYTTGDLQTFISILSGKDQSEFFKQHIFGTTPVPIDGCLNRAGLISSIRNGALEIERKPDPTPLEKAILDGVLGANN